LQRQLGDRLVLGVLREAGRSLVAASDLTAPSVFFDRAVADLGWVSDERPPVEVRGRIGLASRLRVAELATDAVAVASAALSVGRLSGGPAQRAPVLVDAPRVACAFTSERHFRLNGVPGNPWSPFSGFWVAEDGWIRTHGNYRHHARALAAALGVPVDATPEQIRNAVAARPVAELEERALTARALAVAVRPPHPPELATAASGERPWVRLHRALPEGKPRPRRGSAPDGLPLAGLRVLDLTRVIAGPVASRTLAFAGAQVLRVDSPRLPELSMAHLDTGAGKRSVLLDARDADDRATLEALIKEADVVLLGYAPPGLSRLGLDPPALVDRHPGLVIGSLSAWEADGPWAGRRGFDSLVQAATGIAVAEGSLDAPGVLPAQALDHASGYLLAAGVVTALRRQRLLGGSWAVDITLQRTAQLLLDAGPAAELVDGPWPEPTVESHRLPSGETLTITSPAVSFPGAPFHAQPPTSYGSARPVWLP